MTDLTQAKQNLENLLNEVKEQDRLKQQEVDALKEITRLEKVRELGKEGLERYKTNLKFHDWFYEYSDDHRVYTEGFHQKQEIRKLQEILDPDFTVWNSIAPDDFKKV